MNYFAKERSEMGACERYGTQKAAARTTTAIATAVAAFVSTKSPFFSGIGARDFLGTLLGCVYVGETINCTYPMDFRP